MNLEQEELDQLLRDNPEDEVTRKHKGYIGTASGLNEKLDTQHIAEHGSPVDPGTLTEIANYLTASV